MYNIDLLFQHKEHVRTLIAGVYHEFHVQDPALHLLNHYMRVLTNHEVISRLATSTLPAWSFYRLYFIHPHCSRSYSTGVERVGNTCIIFFLLMLRYENKQAVIE